MRLSTRIASVGLTLASFAFATSINTGAAGVNWQVAFNGGAAAAVIAETGTLPVQPGFVGGWVPNGSGNTGVWVGRTAGGGNFAVPTDGSQVGVYVYTLAIGGLNTGSFIAQYAADNNIAWTISGGGSLGGTTSCGVPSATDNDDCYSTLRTLTGTGITASTIITATVRNGPQGATGPNPSGLLVRGDVSPVPEPSTYAMLALGGVAVALARLRRR